MYIKKEVYDALIGAHMREVSAMNDTIASKNQVIEALLRENKNLQARIDFHKAKAEKRAQKPYPWRKPSELKSEGNRAKLTDADDPRNYDKEEHNPYPEE